MSVVLLIYTTTLVLCRTVWGILSAILITAFSFFGVEIVSIAAAESSNPKQKIRRATNLVLYRIILFSWSQCLLRFHLSIGVHRTYKSTGHSNTF